MDVADFKRLHGDHPSSEPILKFNLFFALLPAAVLVSGWPSDHWALVTAMILLLAYFQHTWTLAFHEDVHYSLFPDKWRNVLNGSIIGTLTFVPFTVYQQAHIHHHNKMNTPEDWEMWPYCDPKMSLTFRRCFSVLDLLFGTWVYPWVFSRIYWHKNSPIKKPEIRARIAKEYLGIFVAWAVVIGTVAMLGWWWTLLIAYVIPSMLTGIMQTIRKFTEHLGMPAGDGMMGSRSVLSKGPVEGWRAWINYHEQTHGAHHEYPQLTHHHLEEAYRLDVEPVKHPVFPSYGAAIRDMLPHLWAPGIGEARWVREEPATPAT